MQDATQLETQILCQLIRHLNLDAVAPQYLQKTIDKSTFHRQTALLGAIHLNNSSPVGQTTLAIPAPIESLRQVPHCGPVTYRVAP